MGLLRNTIMVGATRVLLSLLIFFSDLVAARYLGVELKGEYFFLTSGILLAGTFLTGGLHLGNLYYSRTIAFPVLAANTLLYLAATLVLVLAAGWPLTAYLPVLRQGGVDLKALFLCCLALEAAFAVFLNFFVATDRLREYSFLRLFRRGLFFVLLVAAWYLWQASVTLTMGLYLLALVVTVALMGIMLFWGVSIWQVELRSLGICLGYGLRSQTLVFMDLANLRMNGLLLGFWAPPADNGLYSVALNFSQVLWLMSNVLTVIIQSRVQQTEARQLDDMLKLCRHTFLMAVLGGFALYLLAPLLILWCYGSDFQGAVPFLQIMLPGIVFYSLFSLLSSFMITNGRANSALACSLGGFLVNLLLGFLLIPPLGGRGAAMAVSIGLTASVVFLLAVVKIRYNIQLRNILFLNNNDKQYWLLLMKKAWQ